MTSKTIARVRQMTPMRKISLAGGLLYLITFAASIPELKLYSAVINNHDYISTTGSNASLMWGAWLEVITALSGIGTAVALYRVTKRVSQTAAIGFVTSRVTEAALILVGVVSLLSVVTLRQDFAGATGTHKDALEMTGQALVAVRQWTFLIGPGLMAGVNALFLAYAMYRSHLVPRIIPIIGLVGAPLILLSGTATMFGLWDQVSTPAFFFALPDVVWEFSLGVWLTVKGFKATTLATDATTSHSQDEALLVG